MVFESSLSRDEYLSALKEMMSAHTEFGVERFTGFFLGSRLYITHHGDYQWNRKITCHKNAALGFVKQTPTGCEIHFTLFRGLLCPAVAFSLFLIGYLISVALFAFSGFPGEFGIRSCLLICLAIVGITLAIMLPVYTLFEAMISESEDGRRMLLSLLQDPVHPYENLPNIP